MRRFYQRSGCSAPLVTLRRSAAPTLAGPRTAVVRCKLRCQLAALLAATAFLSGCTPVASWDREHLSKRTMMFDEDMVEAQVRRHVYQSREGVSGGYGVNASGCGCG